MKALFAVAVLAGCAVAPEPETASVAAPPACTIRPVTVTSRDFFMPQTLREIRRVNRELRELCD